MLVIILSKHILLALTTVASMLLTASVEIKQHGNNHRKQKIKPHKRNSLIIEYLYIYSLLSRSSFLDFNLAK